MSASAALGTPTTMAIDAIRVGARIRKNLGDLTELMRSIGNVGLLHPVPVLSAGFGDRDQPDRSIVIAEIGDRDRSAATLAVRS